VNSRKSAGQSLVEFAIVLPILVVVLLLAIDVGRVYMGWVNLTNVARIGANYAAQNPEAWSGSGDATAQAHYRALMANDASGINCTLPATLPAPIFEDPSIAVGSRVHVDMTCWMPLLTPLLAQGADLPLLGRIGGLGDPGHNFDLKVTTSAAFPVRFGSFDSTTVFSGSSWPTPPPSPSPSPTPAPTPTPDPLASPTPMLEVGFYGSPTTSDSWGGGPPGSEDENQIWGVPTLAVTFYNTTIGEQGSCRWDFGDGTSSTTCSNSFSHSYTGRGTYTVSLLVDGQTLTRTDYVVVTCKVPAFSGVRSNSATSLWTAAGFSSANIEIVSGTGNYKIGYQSLAGGLVNPPGGCNATIEVAP
jgi:hypothetical protein